MLNRKMKKIIRITLTAGVICIGSYLGFMTYRNISNYNKNWGGEREFQTYEIGGKDDNYVISNSIIGGCNLNQFVKGENLKEYDSDSDGNVYKYEDKEGITYVYEDSTGKIFCVNQECKYSEATWENIKQFWKKLGSREKNYAGSEDETEGKIDWEDPETEMSLSGSSEKYEYCFSKYQNSEYETENGQKAGFDGTAISITITEIEGESDE